MLNFKDRFSKLLKTKGLKGNELSQKADISESTISVLLSGKSTDPKLSTLRSIVEGLNLSPDELYYLIMDGEFKDDNEKLDELIKKYDELSQKLESHIRAGKESIKKIKPKINSRTS